MAKERGWVILRTPQAKAEYMCRILLAMTKHEDIAVSFDLKKIKSLKQKAAIRARLAAKEAEEAAHRRREKKAGMYLPRDLT